MQSFLVLPAANRHASSCRSDLLVSENAKTLRTRRAASHGCPQVALVNRRRLRQQRDPRWNPLAPFGGLIAKRAGAGPYLFSFTRLALGDRGEWMRVEANHPAQPHDPVNAGNGAVQVPRGIIKSGAAPAADLGQIDESAASIAPRAHNNHTRNPPRLRTRISGIAVTRLPSSTCSMTRPEPGASKVRRVALGKRGKGYQRRLVAQPVVQSGLETRHAGARAHQSLSAGDGHRSAVRDNRVAPRSRRLLPAGYASHVG
jgi:hypothetical protein